ncbi:MAG: MATE family efflux transporter [Deltaproteobacteria bacterium]|nr:MATE family efflux transporter [Deltaproteobacteria bacterium]
MTALLKGPLSRDILKLASPVFFGILSQTIFYAVDTAMLGRVGVEALAAAGLGWFIVWIFGSSLMAVEIGTQSLVARRFGEGDWEACGGLLDNTLFFSLSSGFVFSAAGYLLAPVIFPLLSDDIKIIQYGIDYLKYSFLSIFFFLIIASFRGFFDGLGQTHLFMKVAIVMNISNIIFDYALIFGKFGFPRLEVKGAAIASLLSSLIGAAYFVGLSLSSGFIRRFKYLNNHTTFDLPVLNSILRLAFPAMIRVFFIMAGLTSFLWIVGQAGNAELAASNILMTLSSFTFLAGYGFAVAAATMVSQNLGKGNAEAAERYGWEAVKLGLVCMGFLGIIFILFPEIMLELFTDQTAVIDTGKNILVLFGIIQFFDAVNLILSHALQGAGCTKWVMKAEGLVVWLLFLPAAYILSVLLGLGLYGAWISMFAYSLIMALSMLWKFKAGKWKAAEI